MDKFNIALFAGGALNKYQYLTVETLQKYIRRHQSCGVVLPAEEIQEVLDDLVLGNWLGISGSVGRTCYYQRYAPTKKNFVQ